MSAGAERLFISFNALDFYVDSKDVLNINTPFKLFVGGLVTGLEPLLESPKNANYVCKVCWKFNPPWKLRIIPEATDRG